MEIGEYIDKYIITEVMHGGMSEVYRVAIEGAPIRFVLKHYQKSSFNLYSVFHYKNRI